MSLLTAPIRLAIRAARALMSRTTGNRAQTPTAERVPAAEPAAAAPSASRAGEHDAALIAVVSGRPGITVAQAAGKLGLPATALYPIIRRLERRGALVKLGRELHPPR